MAVTSHILRILLDGGKDTDAMILLAEAMERGPDAAIIFNIIDELEAIGSPAETIATVICGAAKGIMDVSRRRVSADVPNGPEQRWGYTGPITPRLPDSEWWTLRATILARDEYTCSYCGCDDERMCVDHVVPLSRGGSNEPDNLVACCIPCNSSKCDKLLDEWEGRVCA